MQFYHYFLKSTQPLDKAIYEKMSNRHMRNVHKFLSASTMSQCASRERASTGISTRKNLVHLFESVPTLIERPVHHSQTRERELRADSSHSLQSSFSCEIHTRTPRYIYTVVIKWLNQRSRWRMLKMSRDRRTWPRLARCRHRRAGFTVRVRGTRSKCGLQW